MTQEFVTLPREVVELAIEALFCTDSEEWSTAYENELEAVKKLRAALDQPQIQSGVIPPNWKLVPVEPTQEMFAAACRDGADLNGRPVWKHTVDVQAAWRWGQMLAAAPQPPAVKQPQANQPAMTPIAQRKLDSLLAEGYTISGYSVYHERKHQHGFVTGAGLVGWWKPEGVEYPQQRCEQEPDWSDSKTLPSELWKNPLLSLQERLQIADGAVQWNREVAENLRARLCAAQQPQGEQEQNSSERVMTVVYRDPTREDVQSFMNHPKSVWFGWCHAPYQRDDARAQLEQPPRQPLTDQQIDAIADAMPGGLEGFLRGWGWRQFARAVIEATNNIK